MHEILNSYIQALEKAMNRLNVISTDIWTPKYFERIVSNVRMYPFAGSGTRRNARVRETYRVEK